jgi:hypothetical protein
VHADENDLVDVRVWHIATNPKAENFRSVLDGKRTSVDKRSRPNLERLTLNRHKQ